MEKNNVEQLGEQLDSMLSKAQAGSELKTIKEFIADKNAKEEAENSIFSEFVVQGTQEECGEESCDSESISPDMSPSMSMSMSPSSESEQTTRRI